MASRIRSFLQRHSIIDALIIFLAAFSLRYHFLTTYNYPMMIHEQDGVGYMSLARDILAGNLPATALPPLYPAVIALFSLLPVQLECAARMASISLDALCVIPLYFLARRYLTRLGACGTALMWAFFSYGLYFSRSPLTQSTFLCCLLSATLALYLGAEERRGDFILFLAGACLALAYLTRPEGIAGFVFGLFLCLWGTARCGVSARSYLRSQLSFLAGFVVLAGPYLMYLRKLQGTWTISTKAAQAVKGADIIFTLDKSGMLGANPNGMISLWMERFGSVSKLFDFVLLNIKTYFHVYLVIMPLWAHLTTVLGIFFLVKGNGIRRSCYLLLLPMVTAPVFLVDVSKTHSYLYPIFPVAFICFMAAVEKVSRLIVELPQKWGTGLRPALVTAMASVLLILPVLNLCARAYRMADDSLSDPAIIEQALTSKYILGDSADFIRKNSSPGDTFMTRWSLIGYFADRPVVMLPKGDIRSVIYFGRKNRVKYLVVDTNSVISRRQELVELLNPLFGRSINPDLGLEPVRSVYYEPLGGYVIYRYLPGSR